MKVPEPRVAIIGYGRVGKAMERFFSRMYETHAFDPPNGLGDRDIVDDCDLAVVCVPTPMRSDGSCDTSIVEDVVSHLKARLILIRSTVPPGTTDKLKASTGKRVVFSPEYVGEPDYWVPYGMMHEEVESPFYIFGGAPDDCQEMVDIFARIAGPTKKYRITSARAAEAVKAFANEYIAWKVIWAAEMREACEALGVPYWEVRDLWALDPRVDPMHTAAWSGSPGFGGKCLPKDTSSLYTTLRSVGYEKTVLKAVIAKNMSLQPDAYCSEIFWGCEEQPGVTEAPEGH